MEYQELTESLQEDDDIDRKRVEQVWSKLNELKAALNFTEVREREE